MATYTVRLLGVLLGSSIPVYDQRLLDTLGEGEGRQASRQPSDASTSISTNTRPMSTCVFVTFVDLVYCLIVRLSPALHDIFHTFVAQYSLFVLKVP